jgi:hypothetical protein
VNDAEYWQQVAAWMGDCLAATAERQIGLRRESASEKRRHLEIVAAAADAMEGRFRQRTRKLDYVIARLRDIQP